MTARPVVNRARLALLLGGLAMFGPFAIDTIFPAFPAIERDFAIGAVAMQQTISVYLIAYALMSVFHGPLSDARGRKPVILWGVVVFGLASIGCALAVDLPQLLAFRALQGMSAGAGLIVGRAIIRDCLDGDDAQRLMSHITMIFGVAPAVAPVVGGWILGWSDWRSIFWLLTAFALALLAMTAAWLPETHPPAARSPLNLRTLWHGNRAILGNRHFLLLAFAGSFNFGALFLYIASAPAFVMELMGLNEQQFGWFFIPMISGMMFGAFLSGRVAGRLTGAQSAGLGFVLCALAMVINLGYTLLVDAPRVPWAVLPMSLNAIGIALVFPILTLAILDLYPRQRGAASSMQAFVGLSFNAVLAGLLSPWAAQSTLRLSLVAAGFCAVAWTLWRVYRRLVKREPGAPREGAALEPTERL
jgi:DHA1 family bicyclomycin/chloramphenicol resistance-like MFS transporter